MMFVSGFGRSAGFVCAQVLLLLPACVISYEERGVKTANGKIQKEQEQTQAQPDGA
jgi:hypothetical protein